MRDAWERTTPDLKLGAADIAALIRPAFPGAVVVSAEKMLGGLANVTYMVRLAGREQPIALRLYVRAPDAVTREHAICRLVAPRVPVPSLHWLAPTNAVTGHPYAVLDWLQGVTLAKALSDFGARGGGGLGRAVGATLAAISSFTFPAAGFITAELRITESFDIGGAGFRLHAAAFLADPLVQGRLGEERRQRLTELIDREAAVLDDLRAQPPCLVHSDFDVTNILVEPAGGGFRVSGVLDWEFAFSGSVVGDLGHILRAPAGRVPGFEAGLIEGFTGAGGRLPRAWRRAAVLADLLAWLDFLKRPEAGAALQRSARQVIDETLGA